jgi:transcriptional antiterminator RfaH
MLRWYLVKTKPAGESVAHANLDRQGYGVYLPRLLRELPGIERTVPLFPRYLFLRLREGEQSLAPVGSSVGVSNVVRFGARYAIVPDHVVNDLQARADPASGLHRLKAPARLTSGVAVRIVAGALAGIEGVFEREAGTERVVVLLRLLGQDASVRVPSRFVQPCHAA